ncbi:MAG: hypothetical protein MUP22_09420 [Desulfobacterales bacterium]|nr:hypothetical protein [Desulfobacterales bacterium]
MKWTISFLAESNIIHVATEGKTAPEAVNQMVKELKEASDHYGSTLFLMDHRKLNFSMKFMEMHERPQSWLSLNIPKNYRITVVASEKDLDSFKYLETVSLNRGYDLLVFTDIESAKEWLKGK